MEIKGNMKPNELNDLFDYGYYIYQNPHYFKFSLDSVLLAEFIQVKKNQKEVLDLCSGNAPIPMILHKKYGNKIKITGIELQKEIYDLGISSLKYNEIEDIAFYNYDVNDLTKLFPNKKFDIVSCNPPYFKANETNYINESEIKAIARHEIKLNLESLIQNVAKVIQNQGSFYLVHRPERMADVISTLNKYNFGIKRVVPVYDDYNKDACLILIESFYNGKNYVIIDKPIFLCEHQSYKNIFVR